MDLELERKKDVTINDLMWIHQHKTGALLKVDGLAIPIAVMKASYLASSINQRYIYIYNSIA